MVKITSTPDEEYVQRKGAETLRVFINTDARNGNLETEVPSIGITNTSGSFYLFLTWHEARRLAEAIGEIEGVARCG